MNKRLTAQEMERITEDDLIWYLCHSEAAAGLQSNWSAMVHSAIYGSSVGFHDHTSSYTLNSVARRRQIEAVFLALPNTMQDTLYASFSDQHFSEHTTKVFNKLAGAASCTFLADAKTVASVCQRINLSQGIKGDKQLITQVRILATKNYTEAIAAYMQEKYEQFKRNRDNDYTSSI